ncbi:hypothetical protein DMI80_09890 [Akkermansia muciniphila]|uniref:hypothetical protein n=1 Tax=Akkermansia muciniphila TaxID=239935 RepID=UPI00138E725B|nr:hypothetical protein [Akkermansia muciniphila]QHV66184.1 hypothetical protein DMI78_09880 [Akkermansia muciniphila]QHV71098.1 hypothetical protein DMI80_09890 [Akkermansia muciniphila]QHV73553.1 hypothetical protein DMI81_09890 [Akkermansia muciniphila]
MKRVAFNGGELSPELALRSDMDVYMRGAQTLENFDVSQMGGIRRRRGMRPFADALDGSRIIPYIYSTDDRYMVEINSEKLRVFNTSGAVISEHDSYIGSIDKLRFKQVNSLLVLTSPDYPIMVLKRNGAGEWTFEEFQFKSVPWREEGYRDYPVTVSRDASGDYSVFFPEELEDVERECSSGDLLRVSYYTTQQDLFNYASQLLNGVSIITVLSPSSNIAKGQKIARRTDETKRYYSCTNDWTGSTSFVTGLTAPENYPDNFLAAESIDGYDQVTPINALAQGMSFKKGDKIVLDSGYWEYWTCIKDFNAASYVSGSVAPEDYPGHFIRGLAIGSAAPCRGTWQFYCSGSWIGEYEVRRSYEGRELTDEWETLGNSYSRIGSTSNTLLTGDEQKEECWLRLFITRSRYEGTSIINGFPADSCSNRLVISPYKHDMLLRYTTVEDESGEIISYSWDYINDIKLNYTGSRDVIDWSWQAYSDKYGYPSLCDVYNQRLVFASTAAQPQTIWMSATDDINNFHVGKTDDSALAVTMSTTTQNPICWLMAQGARLLLGTSDAEWVVSSGGSQSITYANARIDNHGYVGSADTPAIMATDKVVYFERGSGRLYQYGYDFSSDAYVSRDLTVFSDHILRNGGGVRDGCFIRKPDSRAFFVLNNGTAALMTYNSLHEVNCWHRYTTAGTMEYCAVLPNGTESDSLYLIVRRADGRYIEVIDDQSPYIDRYEHDYTSTMITNALTSVEYRAKQQPSAEIKFCFAEETEVEGIQITTDGTTWDNLDRNDPTIPKGWNSLVSSGHWDYDVIVGIRVTGERPLHILAIQG